MGVEVPSLTFKASKKKYNFIAYIRSWNDNLLLNLETNHIEQFQYVNEINQLYPTGELVYTDTVGKLVNYINIGKIVLLDVSIAELTQENTNKTLFGIEEEDEKKKLVQQFVVSNVEILNRSNATITYKLHLVGINYLIFNCQLEYSNYNVGKQSITELIKQCLLLTDNSKNFIYTGKSFEKIEDNTQIFYAAKENDTTITAIKYLLSKFYYFDNYSTSLKFLVYNNMHKNEKNYGIYEIYDLKTIFDSNEEETLGKFDQVVLSMFKTAEESMMYNNSCNLGSVIKMPKIRAYETFFNRNILTYSYAYNNLSSYVLSGNAIAKYANERNETLKDDSLDKFESFNFAMNNSSFIPKMQKAETYWNNDQDIYSSIMKQLTQDNALIVRTDGNICRIPGCIIQILIPPDPKKGEEHLTDIITYEDENDRYKQLGGLWIVAKVRHIFSPTKGIYEQNLVVFKNYTQQQPHWTINGRIYDNTSNLNGDTNIWSSQSGTMYA